MVMVPSILHPFHMRVFVRGPRSALYILVGGLLPVAVLYAVIAVSGPAVPVAVGLELIMLAALGFKVKGK